MVNVLRYLNIDFIYNSSYYIKKIKQLLGYKLINIYYTSSTVLAFLESKVFFKSNPLAVNWESIKKEFETAGSWYRDGPTHLCIDVENGSCFFFLERQYIKVHIKLKH